MGCCYSFFCKEEGVPIGGESNERSRLLVDPVSNNAHHIPHTHSEDFLNRNPSAQPKKTDEQSALNRILQETAMNVIDVAALDSHNLQQHEYLERMKQYSVKLHQACSSNKLAPRSKPSLLLDVPAPERILTSDPINIEDLILINSAVTKASAAMNEIKVEHTEDLVVPFGIA